MEFSFFVGAIILFFIEWFMAFLITIVTLKLNYQKTLSIALPITNASKIVIFPSIIYIFTNMALSGFLLFVSKTLLTGDVKMFLDTIMRPASFIIGIIVFYILLKKSLVKSNIEISLAKTITDSAIKYYVLTMMLISAATLLF